MQQEQPEAKNGAEPLYWESHRVAINLTLLLSMFVAVIGFIRGPQELGVVGLAFAVYTWLTTAKRYLIFENALVIEYGRPRVKVVDFSNISHVEMLNLGVGERLRVVLIKGKRVFVMSKNLETFREKLETALERYQTQYPQGQGREEGEQDGQRGRIIDVERGSDYEGPSGN